MKKVKINGRWENVKRGQVIAPSDTSNKALTLSGDPIMQKLVTTKVDKRTFTSKGNLIKKRKRSNKSNIWQNGGISDRYREHFKIPTKGMYSDIDLVGLKITQAK